MDAIERLDVSKARLARGRPPRIRSPSIVTGLSRLSLGVAPRETARRPAWELSRRPASYETVVDDERVRGGPRLKSWSMPAQDIDALRQGARQTEPRPARSDAAVDRLVRRGGRSGRQADARRADPASDRAGRVGDGQIGPDDASPSASAESASGADKRLHEEHRPILLAALQTGARQPRERRPCERGDARRRSGLALESLPVASAKRLARPATDLDELQADLGERPFDQAMIGAPSASPRRSPLTVEPSELHDEGAMASGIVGDAEALARGQNRDVERVFAMSTPPFRARAGFIWSQSSPSPREHDLTGSSTLSSAEQKPWLPARTSKDSRSRLAREDRGPESRRPTPTS